MSFLIEKACIKEAVSIDCQEMLVSQWPVTEKMTLKLSLKSRYSTLSHQERAAGASQQAAWVLFEHKRLFANAEVFKVCIKKRKLPLTL